MKSKNDFLSLSLSLSLSFFRCLSFEAFLRTPLCAMRSTVENADLPIASVGRGRESERKSFSHTPLAQTMLKRLSEKRRSSCRQVQVLPAQGQPCYGSKATYVPKWWKAEANVTVWVSSDARAVKWPGHSLALSVYCVFVEQ